MRKWRKRIDLEALAAYDLSMSLDAIKDELAKLSPEDQRSVMGYLANLRTRYNEERLRRMAAEIDNADPDNWVSVGEAKKRNALLDAAESK